MSAIGGVLRCTICGETLPRVPKGLNYGFPQCCGKTMVVVTPEELKRENEQDEKFEDEENYRRAEQSPFGLSTTD